MIPLMHIVGACGFRSFRAWLASGRSNVSTRLDARVCPACGASRMLLRTHDAACPRLLLRMDMGTAPYTRGPPPPALTSLTC
jgi:hypothetical protein